MNSSHPPANADSSSVLPATLLGPAQVRELAEELGVSPTKKLGQNFVHDPNTVRKIVAAADITAADHVIEVGPGLGSLTLALLETAASTTVVEIDERLARRLPTTVAEFAPAYASRLAVIHKDALHATRADVAEAGQPQPTALVANLPYNVSVPVLLHFLEEFPTITRVLVMVQLEVADRLAATPGNKVYGVPSVKAGYYGAVRRAATIGKNVFWPAPNVDSGLVRIDRYSDAERPWADADLPALGSDAEEALRIVVFDLANAAFAQRRKTLRAALSGYFGSGAQAEEHLHAAGIEPAARGETLGVGDFVRLARSVK